MKSCKGILKMLMKKWIPTIFSENRGFLNMEGVSVSLCSLPPMIKHALTKWS